MNFASTSQRLGQILISRQWLSQEQLQVGLAEQSRNPQALGGILTALGFISEQQLFSALAEQAGLPFINLEAHTTAPEVLQKVPQELARTLQLLPLAYCDERRTLQIAIAIPHHLPTLDRIGGQLPFGTKIEQHLASTPAIARALDRHYGRPSRIDQILQSFQ